MNVATFSQALAELEKTKRSLEELGDPETRSLALRIGDQIEILRARLTPLDRWVGEFEREEGKIVECQMMLDAVSLRPGDYRQLKRPLRLTVRWGGEYFVARDDKTVIAGAGDSVQDALENYFEVWGDRYNWLVTEEASLGPGPAAELRKLRRLLA